jgi:hypothetical protein
VQVGPNRHYRGSSISVRYSTPNFPCEFEIPDDWLAEFGNNGFPATANAYRSTPETVLVALTDIIPPMRKPAYPKDWRGFERTRLIDLLRGIVADEQIDPVSLIELWPASDPMLSLAYRYSVRDGFHRFYASIIAGFTELPASIQTLSEVLEQSRSFG